MLFRELIHPVLLFLNVRIIIFSQTHLYSSAFVVDRLNMNIDGIPQRFVITGAGWGHGVGLCQIGAAMMSEKGYSFDEILLHYYRGAEIKKIYD